MANDKQRRLEEALGALAAEPGLLGAALVSRDGLCMINAVRSLHRPETFSAMAAAILGASEAALAETGTDQPLRVVIEGPKQRVVAAGASAELLLVVLADAGADLPDTLARIDRTVAKVNRIVDAPEPAPELDRAPTPGRR